jgi:hypothetical protein
MPRTPDIETTATLEVLKEVSDHYTGHAKSPLNLPTVISLLNFR